MAEGLLLIHAFPLDSTMWKPQIEALEGSVPILAPDFPGFGGTPSAGPVSTMDAMADLCAAAVHEARLDRVVVCGLSMGGYAALAFWRRHRALTAGLVLANTRAGADDEAGKQRRTDLAARLRAEGNQFLADNPPPLLSASAAPEVVDYVKRTIGAQPAEAIAAASLGMAERADYTSELMHIEVPTLVITSSKDELIPPDVTKDMADAIPGSEFQVIEHAGHLSNLEAPGVFNELLRGQLSRCGVMSR